MSEVVLSYVIPHGEFPHYTIGSIINTRPRQLPKGNLLHLFMSHESAQEHINSTDKTRLLFPWRFGLSADHMEYVRDALRSHFVSVVIHSTKFKNPLLVAIQDYWNSMCSRVD